MDSFFTFNKANRQWHLPIVVGVCVGLPLLVGWYNNNIEAGKLSSLAGLSILYIQSDKLAERMLLLMVCCFGIMIAYIAGLLFSFNAVFAPIALGLFSFGVHFSLHKFKLTKPPGNFFFIMLASIAVCTPFEPETIPTKIGYVAIGTITTCGIGLLYSLLTLKKNNQGPAEIPHKDPHTNIVESLIFGLFIGISLAIAFAFRIENPYWVPISCLAVMQGSSTKHILLRGAQRIVGTLAGLAITWCIVLLNPTPLFIILSIILLQMIIEFLIVKNYAVAVIFITIFTIFLAESGGMSTLDSDKVFVARMVDIILGSSIGMIGGWALYHEKLHYYTKLHLKKSAIPKNNND